MTKPSTNSTWSTAQQRERHYYATRAASHDGRDQVYAEFHASFWKAILSRLTELRVHEDGVYADVGCGPNPIVAFLEHGRRIGIDPLMPFYQDNFKFPDNFEAFQGTIEELSPLEDGQADVIFSMNNIDHIQDLPKAAAALRRKLKPDGLLVVSVNVVGNPITALASKVFDVYRVIDPTHTYHFHSPQEVAKALQEHFDLVRFEDIESLSVEMQSQKRERDRQAMSLRGAVRAGMKFVKNDILLREHLYLLVFTPAGTGLSR